MIVKSFRGKKIPEHIKNKRLANQNRKENSNSAESIFTPIEKPKRSAKILKLKGDNK